MGLNLEVFSDGISNVGSERENVGLNLEVFSDGISNVGSERENVGLNLEVFSDGISNVGSERETEHILFLTFSLFLNLVSAPTRVMDLEPSIIAVKPPIFRARSKVLASLDLVPSSVQRNPSSAGWQSAGTVRCSSNFLSAGRPKWSEGDWLDTDNFPYLPPCQSDSPHSALRGTQVTIKQRGATLQFSCV